MAPEVLNSLGYGTKADIFSAGIILCIILTGVSPFHGKNYQEVLFKNRGGDVSLTGSHWSFVSAEAKDLVGRMVRKDPQERCTAMEALQHPWFSLEHAQLKSLSNAQENMKRHQNEDRFNVGKIKPEFSMVTCTPLLNSRFNGKDSPLIVPSAVRGRNALKGKLDILTRRREQEEKKENKKGIIIRDIYDKFRRDNLSQGQRRELETPANDSADFDEDDMDERPAGVKEKIAAKNSSAAGRAVPMTPSISSKKSWMQLKLASTPAQNKRNFRSEKAVPYLQQVAGVRLREEVKGKTVLEERKNIQPNNNPFTSELPVYGIREDPSEITETGSVKEKKHDTPKFAAQGLAKPSESS